MVRNYLVFYQVSTYQMCILMLFNRQQSYTYKDIQTESNIPEKVNPRFEIYFPCPPPPPGLPHIDAYSRMNVQSYLAITHKLGGKILVSICCTFLVGGSNVLLFLDITKHLVMLVNIRRHITFVDP